MHIQIQDTQKWTYFKGDIFANPSDVGYLLLVLGSVYAIDQMQNHQKKPSNLHELHLSIVVFVHQVATNVQQQKTP